MRKLTESLIQFIKGEDGPTAAEYGVLVMLVIVACLGAVAVIGGKLQNSFGASGQKLP